MADKIEMHRFFGGHNSPCTGRLVWYVCSRLLVSFLAATVFSVFLTPLLSKGFVVGRGGSDIVSFAFGSVVFAPLFETLVLLICYVALCRINRLTKPTKKMGWCFALLLGLCFAFFHGVFDWAWGVIVIIPGIVFSKALIDWSIWYSRTLGFLVSATIHTLHNTLAVLLLLWT